MNKTTDAGAIIVAAGAGKRFGSATPKQFLSLCGKPVFLWAVRAFKKAGIGPVVVVVPQPYLARLKRYATRYDFTLVAGGAERYDSVQAGLAALPPRVKIVAIHDGARPLIAPDIITASLGAARTHGAAVVAAPAKDTIKLSKNGIRVDATVPRTTVWLAQTPQTFKRTVIEAAYRAIDPAGITDDAQAAEMAGYRVVIVPGDHRNTKITHPHDLELARIFLKGSR